MLTSERSNAKNCQANSIGEVLQMKKLLSVFLIFTVFSQTTAWAFEGIKLESYSSQEELLNNYDKNFEQIKKNIAPILENQNLLKEVDKVLVKIKQSKPEILYSLDLDHSVDGQEFLVRMLESETQIKIKEMISLQVEKAGGFDHFKNDMQKNEKGMFRFLSKLVAGIGAAIYTVLFWTIFYPIFWLLIQI